MINDLTVFVNSCDKYSDAWYPFFKFFDLYGGELKRYPIVLAVEKKDFSYATLNVRVLKYRKNKAWGERMIHELSFINTEFVFFDIEDYFLLKPLDDYLFRIALDYMKNNPEVGYLNLSKIPDNTTQTYTFKDIDPNQTRLHMNTSIWRTSYFLKLLRKHESIWDFERYSCIRARNYPEKCVLFSSKNVCYYYKQPSSINNGKAITGNGYGIVRGKWLLSNVELFKQYDIDVDFSNLGFYAPEPYNDTNDEKKSMLEKLGTRVKLFKKVDNRIKKYKKKRARKLLERSFR